MSLCGAWLYLRCGNVGSGLSFPLLTATVPNTAWPLTDQLQRSVSHESNSSSHNHKISHTFWNPKFHYRVYNSPPPVSILGKWIQSTFYPTYLGSVLSIILQSTHKAFAKYLSSLPSHQNPIHISPTYATCPAKPPLFNHSNKLCEMNTDHKAGHYEIFPILLLLPREDQLQLSNTAKCHTEKM